MLVTAKPWWVRAEAAEDASPERPEPLRTATRMVLGATSGSVVGLDTGVDWAGAAGAGDLRNESMACLASGCANSSTSAPPITVAVVGRVEVGRLAELMVR